MVFNTQFFFDTMILCAKAIPTTLRIFLISYLLSLIFGFILGVLKLHGPGWAKRVIGIYLSVVRGIPLVVQILLLYSIFPSVFQSILDSMGSSYRIYDLKPEVYAYIIFVLNTSAGLTEIFRSGLETVGSAQLEAAYTSGMSTFSAYTRIIIPQALARVLPNLCTTATGVLKQTSLVFLMTIKDITGVAKIAAGYGYDYIEAYSDIWVIYIVLCLIIETIFKLLEKNMTVYQTGRSTARC